MPLPPDAIARALDALAVLGTLDAAAAAAECSPSALVAALRSHVRAGTPATPRKKSASRRLSSRAVEEEQPALPGFEAAPGNEAAPGDEAAVVPRPARAQRSRPVVIKASAPSVPATVAASSPPSTLARSGVPRLTVVPAPLVVHIDAGSRGNPGPAACAFVVTTSEGDRVHGKFLGRQTNNEAEYEGLLMALRWLHAEGVHGARLHMDSQLVVMQVNGAWKVREPRLVTLAAEARTLLATTRSTLHHVRREKNRAADREVNRVLDEVERG